MLLDRILDWMEDFFSPGQDKEYAPIQEKCPIRIYRSDTDPQTIVGRHIGILYAPLSKKCVWNGEDHPTMAIFVDDSGSPMDHFVQMGQVACDAHTKTKIDVSCQRGIEISVVRSDAVVGPVTVYLNHWLWDRAAHQERNTIMLRLMSYMVNNKTTKDLGSNIRCDLAPYWLQQIN